MWQSIESDKHAIRSNVVLNGGSVLVVYEETVVCLGAPAVRHANKVVMPPSKRTVAPLHNGAELNGEERGDRVEEPPTVGLGQA